MGASVKRRLPPLLALRAFEATGRQMSFSKAADELHVTQGAISRQIRLLEEFLRAPLFVRLARHIELTDFGKKYLAAATAALDQIEKVTLEGLYSARTLSVSVLPTIGALWLMPRLTAFMIEHPEIQLMVSSSLEPVDFQHEPVDVAIRVGQLPGSAGNEHGSQITFRMSKTWEGITAVHLWDDFITPVCSRRFISNHGPIRSVDQLRHMPLIHNLRRADGWPAWLSASGVEPFEGNPRVDVGHSFMAVLAARSGTGVACVPTIEIEPLEWRDELVQPFDLQLQSAGAYYMLYPTGKIDEPDVRLFCNWLTNECFPLERGEKGQSSYPHMTEA